MGEDQFYLYIYTIGPAISLSAGAFLIFVCYHIKKMMKHPGSMVLVQTVFMMLGDLQWLTGVPGIFEEIYAFDRCYSLGLVGVYVYFASWGYITALSIEIMLMIKYPVNKNYAYRNTIAHILIATYCLLMVLLTVFLGGPGLSRLGTCFVEIGSDAEYLSLVPLLFNTPIIVYCIISSFMRTLKLGRMILYNHSLVVIVFWGSRIGGVLIYVFDTNGWNIPVIKITTIVLHVIPGLLLCIARLAKKDLIQEIYITLFQNKRSTAYKRYSARVISKNLRMPFKDNQNFKGTFEYLTYADVFDRLTKSTILEILATLTVKFLSEEDMDITTPIQYILYRDTDYYEISRMKINFNDFTSNSYFDRAFKGLNSEAMMQTAEIKEFAPKIFGRIKHELGYTKEMIARALAPIDNRDLIDPAHNYNKGKSSSFIFIDHSEKFVVKSISQKERKYFIKYMIKGYSHRVLHDRNSRLVRIIGLYQFNRNKGNIIIMENVIPNLHSAYLFDLKGSTHDRQTIDSIESIQKGVICKDLDFKLFSEACEIDLCLYESVMQSIAADCEFLKNAGIMDYSLLCGIYDDFSIAATRYSIFSSKKVFNLAIIDILQQYNIKKKTEKRLKEMIYNSEVSSSDPVTYAERFLSFVKENVFRVQLGED